MKQLLLALTTIVSLAGVVTAGETYSSGKEIKQVAPVPPPPCPKWTGFYAGIQGGYERALFDPDLSLSGLWIGTATAPSAERDGSRDFGVNGGQLGGVLGYNFTFNNLLLGIEGSGVYTCARDSRVDHFSDPNIGLYRVSTSVDSHYLATVGPRIGWTFCKWMPFITGGAAFSDLNFHQSLVSASAAPNTEGGSTDNGHVGWFVGGGLEYAITDHWHIRGDYKYADFGQHDSFSSDFATGFGAPMHSRIELREHVATAAIVYQF